MNQNIETQNKTLQVPKLVIGIARMGRITIGLCPTCGNWVTHPNVKCNKCFQLIKWN